MNKNRSLIKMLKTCGPKTDPCGTPDIINSNKLYRLLGEIVVALLNKYKFTLMLFLQNHLRLAKEL